MNREASKHQIQKRGEETRGEGRRKEKSDATDVKKRRVSGG